jgi:putative glutamine amidotransferase
LIPNNKDFTREIVNCEELHGLLLTGGNSLSKYGGDAVERDQVEVFLLEWSISKGLPVLGVCRGMQLIQDFFSNQLLPVHNHVGVRHKLSVEANTRLSEVLLSLSSVNSYQEYGATEVTGELICCASSSDGVIKAVEHASHNVYGVMWHSEREDPFVREEKEVFNLVYQ